MNTVKQVMRLPFTVFAPWPPYTLSPNARIHWRRLAALKANYKRNCMAHFQGQGLRDMKLAEGTVLNITMMFTPPVSREHDADNLVARSKYALDALKDVIQHDDKYFRIMPVLIDQASRNYAGITISVERAGG